MARKRSERQVFKKPTGVWAYRYYDAEGVRKQKGGFASKGEASDALEEALKVKRGVPVEVEPPTVAVLIDEYLESHSAEENTLTTLGYWLKHSRDAFGDVRCDRLTMPQVKAWRKQLSEASGHHYHTALRQVLNYAVACKYVSGNVAGEVKNPRPKRPEVRCFASWDEVEAVADELLPHHRAIPILGAGTGLRPEEWLALTRADIDREKMLLGVNRVFTDGRVKAKGKTPNSVPRLAPLIPRVLAALDAAPTRIDSQLLFPGVHGAHMDLHSFRAKHWKPALRAAGLDYRTPYALRHTYASFSLAAGVPPKDLAELMGTSLLQISETYGHALPDAHDRARAALERFGNAAQAAEGI